jgi:undecaprenyl-diphosphatase
MIPGRSLEETDPAAVGDDTLEAAWAEVARLHRAGIAHGDLGRHSLVVDADGRPWLVDFDHATAVASERLRQADLVELLVSLAVRLGPDRPTATAAATVGREPLAAALAAIPPGALTRTTREELADQPDLWDALTRRVATPPPAGGRHRPADHDRGPAAVRQSPSVRPAQRDR